LNYFSYNKNKARHALASSLGWESYGEKHCESVFTRFTQFLYLPSRHRIDYRRAFYSSEICTGALSREIALTELEKQPWTLIDWERDMRYVAGKLGYSFDQLHTIMRSAPRWYKDFSNREFVLGVLYTIYRSFLGRQKASNF
jgi:hypothetical protein